MFSVDYATLKQVIGQFLYTGVFRAPVAASRLLPGEGHVELQVKEGKAIACRFVTMNMLITASLLIFLPKAPDFAAYLQANAGPVFGISLTIQLLIALICFIVITSLQESLVRADKAEEITKLQQSMAEQTAQELQTKRQLDAGVQEIVAGLTRFSNGDGHARINLQQGHLLWPIAGTINNLMSRFVRLREQEQPMEQTVLALHAYLREIRRARITGAPPSMPETGTEVDLLVKELLAYSASLQSPRQNTRI